MIIAVLLSSLRIPIIHVSNILKYSGYWRLQMFLSKMQKAHKICL